MPTPDFYIEGTPYYKAIIAPNNENVPYLTMVPQYIVIHETENYDPRADAWMHNKFVRNGGGSANVSFTYAVDDQRIVQNLKLNQVGWQAGDGFYGKGNRRGISIEMCENRGSSRSQTEKNTQALVRYLLKKFPNIEVYHVEPHKSFSSYGKNCPSNLLPRWDSFINGIPNGPSSVVAGAWFVKEGDSGDRVEDLQKNLRKLGYTLKIDGSFGPETDEVFREFQEDIGITVDGSYGPNSQKAMNKSLREPRDLGGNYKGKVLRIIYKKSDGINIYRTPDWEATPYHAYKYGETRDILGKYLVDGSEMFKIRGNDGHVYWITAAEKYVEVKDKGVYQMAVNKESTGFVDVEEGAYYADAVKFLAEEDILSGIGNDEFGSDDVLRRKDFAIALYRYAKQEDDITYDLAIEWVKEQGIMSGYPNGDFGGTDPLKRRDFAVALYRYAKSL